MTYNFHNTYTRLSHKLFQKIPPPHISHAKIVLINPHVIQQLGIQYASDQNPQYLLGDIKELPFAQAYAGHQFGYFTNLGDGRAMMLGEHITPANERIDIQLKGSGKTPYSRRGDGKATMSSMMREFLFSYAMDHLGIDTSLSIAVVSTDEEVMRNTVCDGAILIRAMKSHIRFGTFEYVSRFCSEEDLREFTEYVIERHYPQLIKEKQKYIKFFRSVMRKTIDMVINWYRVGFIHGVMNTDNMSITGETFDYGPCAFLNRYDPLAAYSQVDTEKRYCFGNQRRILKWNLGIFGNTLLPLFDKSITISRNLYQKEMKYFDEYFETRFLNMMKNKLGMTNPDSSKKLIYTFLQFLEENSLDYTNTFIELMYPNSFDKKIYQSENFRELKSEIRRYGFDIECMKKNNPQRILRNYIVEDVLKDYQKSRKRDKMHALLKAISSPYKRDNALIAFQQPPSKEFDTTYTTHCNT